MEDTPKTLRPAPAPADLAALLALCGAAPPESKGAEMKNSHTCPKCGSRDIVRIPDHPSRYASGSNIYTTRYTLLGKVPVIRYVSCGCGYVENWVESPMELVQIHQTYGAP